MIARTCGTFRCQFQALTQKVANQLFAELEEQVERTLVSNFAYKYVLGNSFFGVVVLPILGLLALALLGVFLLGSSPDLNRSLNSEDVRYLSSKANAAKDANDKIDFLFEVYGRQVKNLNASNANPISVHSLINLKNLFIAFPLLIIIGCLVFMLRRCYPWTVFSWGDYEEHYRKILSTKKTLWTVLILSLLVGIMGNLFVFGLSGYIKAG